MVAWTRMVVVKERISGWSLVEVTEFKNIYICKVQILRYQAIKMDAGLRTGAESWKSHAMTGVLSLAVNCGEVWVI